MPRRSLPAFMRRSPNRAWSGRRVRDMLRRDIEFVWRAPLNQFHRQAGLASAQCCDVNDVSERGDGAPAIIFLDRSVTDPVSSAPGETHVT